MENFDYSAAGEELLKEREEEKRIEKEPNVFDYSKAANDLVGERQDSALNPLIRPAVKQPVAAAIKTNDLSKKTGLPKMAVQQDPVEAGAIAREGEIKSALVDAPETKKFLAKDNNIQAAHNDVENLSEIEKAWDKASKYIGSVAVDLASGAVDVAKQSANQPEVAARAFGAGIVRDVIGKGISGLSDANQAAANMIMAPLNAMIGREYGDALGPELPWWLSPAQSFGGAVEKIGEDIAPKEKGLFVDVMGGVGQASAQIAMAILTSGTSSVPSLLSMIGQGSSIASDTAEREGKKGTFGGDVATLAGGSITAVTEKYGLDAWLTGIPAITKNKILQVLAGATSEGAQEITEQVLQNLSAFFAYGKDAEKGIIGASGITDAATAYEGGVGAIVGGLVSSALGGGRYIQERKQANKRTEAIKDLNNKPSELRESSTEMYADAQGRFMRKQGVETVEIDAAGVKVLFQSDDPFDLVEDSVAQEAIATGGSISISPEEYWALPKETIDKIATNTSFGDGQMSEQESTEVDDLVKEFGGTLTEEEIAAEQAGIDPENQIYTEVYNQLLSAGATSVDAGPKAAQMAAVFNIFGQRAGIDPLKVAERFLPSIRKQLPEFYKTTQPDGQDYLIERVKRAASQPTEQQALGQTLLEFIAQRGGIIDKDGEFDVNDMATWQKANPFIGKLLQDMPADLGADMLGGGAAPDLSLMPDYVREAAVEAGFLEEGADINDLLMAVGEELQGRPSYSIANQDADALATAQSIADLLEFMDRNDIDVGLDSQEIKKQIAAVDADISGRTLDQPGSPAFDAWAGDGYETVESEEINYTDFSEDKPYVLKVFHGTTHNIDLFLASVRGNKEGQFGAVNYFTSSEGDANENYAGQGPDLTGRIEGRSVEIESDNLSEHFNGTAEDLLLLVPDMVDVATAQSMIDSDIMPEALAARIAYKEMTGGKEQVLEMFVRTEKPFVVGADVSPWIEFVDFDALESEAIERVAEDNDVSVLAVKEDRENYEEQIDETRWEIEADTPNALTEAIEEVAAETGIDAKQLLFDLMDISVEGLSQSNLEKTLRDSEALAYAEDQDSGRIIGSHVIGQIIQKLGFDSIILKNAEERFTNMNMEPGTAHVHVFDENNRNIKSVNNRGTYDPNDPRIMYQQIEKLGINEDVSTEGTAYQPKKTRKAYKLFAIHPNDPGKLFPLYVGADTPMVMGEWMDAAIGDPGKTTKTGKAKVKSKIGDLAFRPGWHAGTLPFAHQIGGKDADGNQAIREPFQVWAEVEVADDVDWQTEANSRASTVKSGPNKGNLNKKEAQIDDQIPVGGNYEYNTSSNVKGTWVISGSVKVNRVLSDAEVETINSEAGVQDYGRVEPRMDESQAMTFFQDGSNMFGNPLDVTPTGGAKGKTILIEDIGRAFNENHQDVHGEQFFPETDEAHHAEVMKMAKAELEAQMKRPNSGVGWYEQDVVDALVDTAALFPTLLTDKSHRDLYLMFAGIFSNGMNPAQAWEASAIAFEQFLESGEIPTSRKPLKGQPQIWAEEFFDKKKNKLIPRRHAGYGVRDQGNRQQLSFLKYLVESKGGVQQAVDWMKAVQSPLDINNAMRDSGAYKGKYPRFTKAEENNDAHTFGALAFGDKLGRYTIGLHGVDIDAGDTTVDLWYTRTFRRWTGRLFEPPLGDQGVAAQPKDDVERDAIFRVTEDLVNEYKLKPGDVQAVLWFFEKRLWHEHGAALDEGTNSKGAANLLRKRGIEESNDGDASSGKNKKADRQGGKLRQERIDFNERNKEAPDTVGMPTSFAEDQLFQTNKDGPRGSITFGQNMDEIVIRLFKAENLSTFLHESGHLYLEMMSELSQMPTASQGLKDDFQVVRDWLGMEPGEAFTTEQHEKWAETYEKYLQTAEAPSVGLLDAFAKFSSWLNVIYKKFGLKRAKLTPEIHGVMDRMLASEEAIREARGFASMEPMFADAAQAGVTEEQFQKYILDKEKAQQAQTAELVAQNLKDISRETNKWWKEQSAALTKKILIELDADQTWLMAYAIKNGKLPSGAPLPAYLDAEMKIDRKALAELIDAQAFRFMPGGMLSNSGSDPDSVAAAHGFNSGSEMIQAFQAMPKNENGKFLTPAQFAKAEAQKRMTEEHGDMLTDGTMHEEALIRVHSENQSRLIARELKWLIIQEAKKGNAETGKSRTVNSKIAKAAAKRIIANKKVGQILTPNKFLNAEMKAAKQAMAATLKGDFSVAAEAKQRQLLNFHLYREARTAAEKSTKIATKLSKLQRDIINPKVIHPDFVAQVKELLSDVSFGKKAGEKRIQTLKLKALDAFVAESEKEWGASFAISPELDRALSNDNYQDMTFSELDGLNDTVTSIMAQGRKFSKTKQDELKALVSDITNSIEYNFKTKKKESREDKFFTKLARGAIQFVANHRQISSLSLELDGYEANGLMQKHVFNRIKRANDAYLDRGMSAAREMNKILGVYSKKELTLFYMNKTYIPAIDDSLSLSGRLSFALNMGNTGNADVMLEEYSPDQINAVLSTLTDKDWDVVEAMWKHIDSYWNDTLDANGNVIAEGISSVERRVTGVIPQKIDAAPFTTPSGRVISGGYYPLVADPHRGTKSLGRADMDARNSLEGLIGGAHSKSTTKNGSTTERTGGFAASGRVVQLDLSVAFNHVDGIVKDIEMREAVVEVDQLIRKLNKPIKEAKGDQFYQQYESFIKDVVGVREPVDIIEKIVQYSRTGASIAEMGLSVRTMLQQPFGITQTIALIGEKYTTIGTAEFFAGSGRQVRGVASRLVGNSGAEISNKAVEKVMSLSSFMRNRGATFNRDVKDAQKMMGVKGLQDDVVNFSFKGIQMLDMAVSIPSWLGAYQKAQDEGMTLDEAVDYADSIVARGQGSGLERDMSSLQRGNVWKKMFTMFYTFFNAYYNVQADMFKQTKFSSPKSLSRYLLNQVWVTMIPSMLIDYLFNGGPEDDENPFFWGLKSTGSFMFGGMLLVRDVVNAMKTGFGYQMSPAGGVASKTVAAVQQVAQGEADVQLTKALLMALGYLGHVPGTRTATRFVDVVDDQGFDPKDPEFWWRAFVMGKKK